MTQKILIVEDDEAIQMLLAELLELEGYRTNSVSNGKLALEFLEKEALPNLILLDLSMPVMDGLEFFDVFKNKPAWLKKTPVIIMSAADKATINTIKTRAPELTEIIRKPFDIEHLLTSIRECCPPN